MPQSWVSTNVFTLIVFVDGPLSLAYKTHDNQCLHYVRSLVMLLKTNLNSRSALINSSTSTCLKSFIQGNSISSLNLKSDGFELWVVLFPAPLRGLLFNVATKAGQVTLGPYFIRNIIPNSLLIVDLIHLIKKYWVLSRHFLYVIIYKPWDFYQGKVNSQTYEKKLHCTGFFFKKKLLFQTLQEFWTSETHVPVWIFEVQ